MASKVLIMSASSTKDVQKHDQPDGTLYTKSLQTKILHGVALFVIALISAFVIQLLVTNDNFGWPIFAKWFFSEIVLEGVLLTLYLTAIVMLVASICGTLIALARMSDSLLISLTARVYIWFTTSIPELVQLLFWYNIAALVPAIAIGIPFGPTFVTYDVTNFITPLLAAIISFGTLESAYMSEIIRGGLLSVPSGQLKAASALGITKGRTLWRIHLPQSMRFIVPPTGNQVIRLLKGTSLVSVISLTDLLYSVQTVYYRTFETIPLLLVACVWYLIMNTVLGLIQQWLEARYGRGMSEENGLRSAPMGFGMKRNKKRTDSVGNDE